MRISIFDTQNIRNCRYLIPVLLGFLFSSTNNVVQYQGNLHFTYTYVLTTIIYCFLLLLFFRFIEYIFIGFRTDRFDSILQNKARLFSLQGVYGCIKGSIIIIFCWMPYALFSYPGIYWADTKNELGQYFTGAINDHHPFLDTIIFGKFAQFGVIIAGNPRLGLYVLILIQMIAACIALAAAVTYLVRFKAPASFQWMFLLFFSLFPPFPLMMTTLVKDTISTPFLVGFCICFAELCRTHGESIMRLPWLLLLILTSVGFILFKKTGLYIVAISLFVLIILHMKQRMKVLIISVVVCLLLFGNLFIPKFILPALHVTPGERGEMYSVPLQQFAHVIANNPNTMSMEHKDVFLNTYSIPYDQVQQNYRWTVSDPIKGLNEDADMIAFLSSWINEGVKHPTAYLSAWLGLSQSWFSMDTGGEAFLAMPGEQENVSHIDYLQNAIPWDVSTIGRNTLVDTYSSLKSLAVADILLAKGFWASLLPALLLFLCLGISHPIERRKSFVLISPVLLCCLSIYLGPMSIALNGTRYVFQLVCITPFFLAILLTHLKMHD